MSFNFLPKDIENIIISYKNDLDTLDKLFKIINNNKINIKQLKEDKHFFSKRLTYLNDLLNSCNFFVKIKEVKEISYNINFCVNEIKKLRNENRNIKKIIQQDYKLYLN